METVSISRVKARKEHVCDWCCEMIEIGQMYQKQVLKTDFIYDWRNHIFCEEIAQKLKMFDDVDEGLSSDDFLENIKNEYIKIMSNECNNNYELKDYKTPKFQEQLDCVLSFHGISKNVL
jgi:hypothetical protein